MVRIMPISEHAFYYEIHIQVIIIDLLPRLVVNVFSKSPSNQRNSHIFGYFSHYYITIIALPKYLIACRVVSKEA